FLCKNSPAIVYPLCNNLFQAPRLANMSPLPRRTSDPLRRIRESDHGVAADPRPRSRTRNLTVSTHDSINGPRINLDPPMRVAGSKLKPCRQSHSSMLLLFGAKNQ